MPSSTLEDLADAYTQVSLINKRLLDAYETRRPGIPATGH